ncbi:MAG: hypothetical protein IJZ83_02755 [Clostridia bacterium]|nr:hypothetical protein [Clostridia bacterium]
MATKKINLNNNTELQPEVVLDMLAKRGLIAENGADPERIKKAKQEQKKQAYHNTEMLLKHYRTIAWLLECLPNIIAEELDERFESVDQLIGRLDVEMAYGNKKLESRLQNVQKTRLLLDRVNEALTVLKKKPGDGERLYELIYLTYISPESLTHPELLYRLNTSSRQYYRWREQAINILSIRLWAAITKQGDFWLEMLTILDSVSLKGED